MSPRECPVLQLEIVVDRVCQELSGVGNVRRVTSAAINLGNHVEPVVGVAPAFVENQQAVIGHVKHEVLAWEGTIARGRVVSALAVESELRDVHLLINAADSAVRSALVRILDRDIVVAA